ENSSVGDRIGTLSIIDDSKNNSYEYTIVSQVGVFGIEEDALIVRNNTMLDFERCPFILVSVKATRIDSQTKFTKQTFNISVIDVNEPPLIIIVELNNIPENSQIDKPVIAFRVEDPDLMSSVTCLARSDTSNFTI
ncbi:unnamed protein product, partial [Owenia fusiformis]